MSKAVKIGSLVVAAVAVAAVALAVPSLAFAQGPADPGTPGTPTGPGGFGPHGGMMGNGYGSGWMAQYRDEIHAAIAKALGLSVEEFDAARASGQTVWQIAQVQGVSAETLQAAMQTARANVLAQAVADGTLTQAQADTMLAHMNARTAQGGGWGMGRGSGPQGGYNGDCPWVNN